MIRQSLQFILFCVQKKILYQIVVRSSKRLFLFSFDDNVDFIDEENNVTCIHFDFSITFYPETPTKIRQINWERKYFPDPVKNPSAVPATINITILLMSSIRLISFWTRTIGRTWFQQLLCHSTTLMIDTLCPISTSNQQLTNLEQTHIRCSIQCERWTVKGRDCASALHSFKEISYRKDEWTKYLLRLKSWVFSANPEQWMELRHLWWTVNIINYSHLFQLFDFYCLLVQYLFFFWKLSRFFPFFDEFE